MAVNAEKLESADTQGQNQLADIAKLRRECSDLVESKDSNKQFSSQEDIEENRRFLQSADAHDPKKLQAFKDQYLKSVKFDQDKIKEYDEKLKKKAAEGLLSEASIPDYQKWFREQKAQKKAEYIKKCDLDNDGRVKVKAEFEDLNKNYFTDLGLRRSFFKADLQGKQKMVAELKEKRQIIEAVVVLPSAVREFLRHSCANLSVEACRAKVADAQKQHESLKRRFLKLPPLVQEEHREKFKGMMLGDRADLLNSIEKRIFDLTVKYREKIRSMQQPNEKGLTLFSNTPEHAPGSSASLYMDWFTNKLSLSGMKNAVANSDLDDGRRETYRKEMGGILDKMDTADRKRISAEFNAAELSGRKTTIDKYNKQLESTAGSEKPGVVQKILRKILSGDAYSGIKKKMQTFAIVSEITKRRRRFRLTHHTYEDDIQEAAKTNEVTAEKSAKFKEKVKLQDLRDQKGHVRVKMDTLETHQDARTELMRFLKPDLANTQAQLAGDISLRTETGQEVKDEETYKHTELKRELEGVQDAALPVLNQELRAHGQLATKNQIDKILGAIDWEKESQETIRQTMS